MEIKTFPDDRISFSLSPRTTSRDTLLLRESISEDFINEDSGKIIFNLVNTCFILIV